jgi:hypothetical protein
MGGRRRHECGVLPVQQSLRPASCADCTNLAKLAAPCVRESDARGDPWAAVRVTA